MKKKNMIVGIMSVSLLINITFSVEASESNINELSEEVTITDEKNDVDVSFDDENDDESDEVEVTLENDEERIFQMIFQTMEILVYKQMGK